MRDLIQHFAPLYGQTERNLCVQPCCALQMQGRAL